jgi:AcrR family transcriptional regulator
MMRDTIFEAASSLLEEHGSDALTMNQVATKVGFATASLYNYFHDKDDLLHFCYSRLVEPCLQATEEAARADLPAPRKLERIFRTALEYAVKHRGLIKLMAGMDYDSKVRKDIRPRILQTLTTIFERGIEEGSFRPHDPTHTARMILGSLSELFDLQAGGASNEDVNRFADTLIDAVLNGFSIHVEKSPGAGEASPNSSSSQPST